MHGACIRRRGRVRDLGKGAAVRMTCSVRDSRRGAQCRPGTGCLVRGRERVELGVQTEGAVRVIAGAMRGRCALACSWERVVAGAGMYEA